MHHLLDDIGVAVIAATFLGLIAHWLRQPIILGYLIAGALIGPHVFGLITDAHNIEVISELGLVLLLFIIGLEMNLKELLRSGKQLLLAGFGQFLICAALGVAVFPLMGYGLKGNAADGLYLALMCALSSTAIVVKLLYDKGELDTMPGRLTLGILVIQDVYAIFVLAFQPNFANPTLLPILKALGGTVGLLALGFVVSRYALKYVFLSIAKTPEMILAVSIGWCAAIATAAAAMGLSKEMGALVAGLCISAFPYSIHVTAKTLPLRDFFLTLFFMSLGMKITPPTPSMVLPVLAIIGFVFLSRFLSILPLALLAGAGRRTGFIASLNLAQISEFSLVIASLGSQTYKHISPQTVAMMIYAMAIMAVISSYSIRYNHQLYLGFNRILEMLRPGGSAAMEAAAHGRHYDIVLLGFHRSARAFVEAVAKHVPDQLGKILVIDFNPNLLDELRAKGVGAMFGDVSSLETLKHAHLNHARLVISTIPDMLLKGTDNLGLVRAANAVAPHATIVATADDARHEQRLRAEGADLVIRPHDLVGDFLVTTLQKSLHPHDDHAKRAEAPPEPALSNSVP
jgi:Kef-type K+ transport system membrane component KefB